jgi:3-oxoacyl-[acyl-carrier-protein] synthase II
MISIQFGAKGPNYTTVSACASSTHAIGDSFEIIRRGAAKAVITGGTEGAIAPTGLGGFCAAKALSTRNDDPTTACRPFDKTRDGFVMAEGACIVVLEELEHAVRRGAPILGEIVGFGMTGDAYNMVAPDPDGGAAAYAMRYAVNQAGLGVNDIDYVNAHAPGTPGGDDMEARALQSMYEATGYSPAVNSTKPIHGHLLGATGAMELFLSLMTIQEGLIPRTLNTTEMDDDIWLDVVRGENREARVDVIMNNSFGFGGHNAVVVAKRYEN